MESIETTLYSIVQRENIMVSWYKAILSILFQLLYKLRIKKERKRIKTKENSRIVIGIRIRIRLEGSLNFLEGVVSGVVV